MSAKCIGCGRRSFLFLRRPGTHRGLGVHDYGAQLGTRPGSTEAGAPRAPPDQSGSGSEDTSSNSWNIPSASFGELPAPAGRPTSVGPPPPQLAPEFFRMDVDSGGSELLSSTWSPSPVPEPLPAQPSPSADNPWAAYHAAKATWTNGPLPPWVSRISSAVDIFVFSVHRLSLAKRGQYWAEFRPRSAAIVRSNSANAVRLWAESSTIGGHRSGIEICRDRQGVTFRGVCCGHRGGCCPGFAAEGTINAMPIHPLTHPTQCFPSTFHRHRGAGGLSHFAGLAEPPPVAATPRRLTFGAVLLLPFFVPPPPPGAHRARAARSV